METGWVGDLRIPVGRIVLEGRLDLPRGAQSLVVFAHGSGSSRFSVRNTMVARHLGRLGLGTLLFDLLTAVEDRDMAKRFDIGLLTERLVSVTRWLEGDVRAGGLRLGYFGASTGAAAALGAAARLPEVAAVVSRGGRPDLAMEELQQLTCPVLLIVGGRDTEVIRQNREALARMPSPCRLRIVSGAGHLFEEPGTLEEVARLAGEWFMTHLETVGSH